MMTLLLIVHLFVTIGLVGLVLVQRSEGGGLGIGGGGGGGFMTTRGTANVLTRATMMFATAFFITSITLSLLAGLQRGGSGGASSVTDSAPASAEQPFVLPDDLTTAPTGESAGDAPAESPAPAEDDGLPEVPVGE